MNSKFLKYVRSYLFCLGDLYFQTVDVLRGRVTTDIIVIYFPMHVEPKMGVKKKYLLKYILYNSKMERLHVCIKVCTNFVFLYLQNTV